MDKWLSKCFMVSGLLILLIPNLQGWAQGKVKTETFDRDPGWDGHNNRPSAPPATVRQDFGFTHSQYAGGETGEIGGFISPAGEPAYYAKIIPTASFKDKLSASGTLACPDGEFHLLLGFFNADTINEWRTPNTMVLRLNGRGTRFLAYLEYLTQKWRIADMGGQGFPSVVVPKTGEPESTGFEMGGQIHKWSLAYDPVGENGKPVMVATLDGEKSVCLPDPAYLTDGAEFNRFGILNIVKSADTGGEIYFDNLIINGQTEVFDADPNWDSHNNRQTYQTQMVRPRFDIGFSPTHFSGGQSPGEMGGLFFRGDCRYQDRMAYYGDGVGKLTLNEPFIASGKIALMHGVSDSTTLFGFFDSKTSMEISNRQDSGTPKCLVGIAVEGPSSEGFFFYPVYRNNVDGEGSAARHNPPLRIYPDGMAHDWILKYDPLAGGGNGQISVTLDGQSISVDLKEEHRRSGASFDRFGLITPWIDGNGQTIYFDDLTYTVNDAEGESQ